MTNEYESEAASDKATVTSADGSLSPDVVVDSGKAKRASFTRREKSMLTIGIAGILALVIWGPGFYAYDNLSAERACFLRPSPPEIMKIVAHLAAKAQLSKRPHVCIGPASPKFATGTSSVSTRTGESAIFIHKSDVSSPHLEAILAHEISHIKSGDSYRPHRSLMVRRLNCHYGKTIELEADLGGAQLVGFDMMIALFANDKHGEDCGADPHPSSSERAARLRDEQKKTIAPLPT